MSSPIILPNAADVYTACYSATVDPVAYAKSVGPLPRLYTDEFVNAPVQVRRAVLLVLGLAWVTEDPRQQKAREQKAIAEQIHGGDREFWRRFANNHIPHEEMQRRRGYTNGDAA